jgi:hypothetical protein
VDTGESYGLPSANWDACEVFREDRRGLFAGTGGGGEEMLLCVLNRGPSNPPV